MQGPLLALPPLELWSLFFIHIFSLLERRVKGRSREERGGEGRRGKRKGKDEREGE